MKSVSYAEFGPLQNSTSSSNIQLEGYRAGEEENMDCNVMVVGPKYFETLGTLLLSGRGIEVQGRGQRAESGCGEPGLREAIPETQGRT